MMTNTKLKKNDSIVAEEFRNNLTQSFSSYFKVFSSPTGVVIRIQKDYYNSIPPQIVGKIGKIESFSKNKNVFVEVEDKGIFEVPYNCIEIISNEKVKLLEKIKRFIKNAYFSKKKIYQKNEKTRNKVSNKDIYKMLSLPIGTKIRIKDTSSEFLCEEIIGKNGKIDSFLNYNNVLVEIEDKRYEVPYTCIEIHCFSKITFTERIKNFIINKFFSYHTE